ncbi:MAG: hypothetical protein COW10_04495, partial [Candidatus Omnitrophica bacterium CG12_big_fil_rev_8_21_14_0_65_42_8]
GATDLKTTVKFGHDGTNWVDAQYDQYGRLSWYKECRIDEDLGKVAIEDLSTKVVTERTGIDLTLPKPGIVYDDETGQVLSYMDITTDAASPDLKITTKRVFGEIQIDANGNPVVDSQGIPLLVANSKGYNALGQAVGYYDIVIEEDATGQDRVNFTTTTVRVKGDTRYDNFGRLSEYHDLITDTRGILTDRWTKGVSYDDATGRMTGFREEINSDGVQTIRQRAIDAVNGYNTLGQLKEYSEDSWVAPTDDNKTILKSTTWIEGKYYSTGQLMSYTEDIEERGYTCDASGVLGAEITGDESYYARISTNRLIAVFVANNISSKLVVNGYTGYNSLGQLVSYKDIIHRSPHWNFDTNSGVETILYKSGISYDIIKQAAGFNQDEYIIGTDANGKNVDITRNTDRVGVSIWGDVNNPVDVSKGRLSGYLAGYTETVVQKNNAGSKIEIDLETSVVRETIEYNENSQVKYYKDTTTSTATPELTLVTHFGASYVSGSLIQITPVYGNGGNLADYREARGEFGSTLGAFIPEENIHRYGIHYNGYGQVVSYLQNSAAIYEEGGTFNEGLITDINRIDTKYDSAGQSVYYKEEITTSAAEDLKTTVYFGASGLDASNNPILSAPKFDVLGRFTDYSEYRLEQDKDNPNILNVATLTSRSGINYNLKSQISGYAETVDRQGQTKTQTTRTGTEYNGVGQVMYYHDRIINLNRLNEEGAAVDLVIDTYFGDDDAGGNDSVNDPLSNDKKVIYEKGRLTQYTEYRVEDDLGGTDDLTVASVISRSGIEYNNQTGQVTGYIDEVSRDGQAETKTTRDKTKTEYNLLGQLKWYT